MSQREKSRVPLAVADSRKARNAGAVKVATNVSTREGLALKVPSASLPTEEKAKKYEKVLSVSHFAQFARYQLARKVTRSNGETVTNWTILTSVLRKDGRLFCGP